MSPICLIVLLHSCIALLPWAGRAQQCNNALLHCCIVALLTYTDNNALLPWASHKSTMQQCKMGTPGPEPHIDPVLRKPSVRPQNGVYVWFCARVGSSHPQNHT